MNDEFNPVNNDEILSLNHQDIGRQLNLSSHGFADLQIKAENFVEVIKRRLIVKDSQGQSLFDKGINCQVIKLDAPGWQKGRLRARVVLEFCPDEPELPQ